MDVVRRNGDEYKRERKEAAKWHVTRDQYAGCAGVKALNYISKETSALLTNVR
jgi:hypothetical protein